MSPLKQMKEELKALAKNISLTRAAVKEFQRSRGVSNFPPDSKPLWKSVPEFRHKHIAYCLARGRSYEQIESKVHEGNEPKWDIINALLKKVQDEQAAFRASQIRPVA